MMTSDFDPLQGPIPEEIPLPRAPLARVIVQVRFSTVLSIEESSGIASFQEIIRQQYPHLIGEQINPSAHQRPNAASNPNSPSKVWRFFDTRREWRASIGTTFLSLETVRYTSRQDLLDRLSLLLGALENTINPTLCVGIGARYIDRITGPELKDISKLIRPELLGLSTTPIGEKLDWSLSESSFVLEHSKLHCRWGQMPANMSAAPSAIEPIAEPSWVLDLDNIQDKETSFNANDLTQTVGKFCQRNYAFFRWSVTNEFLRRYGGNV